MPTLIGLLSCPIFILLYVSPDRPGFDICFDAGIYIHTYVFTIFRSSHASISGTPSTGLVYANEKGATG